jgi:glutathione S-transferase
MYRFEKDRNMPNPHIYLELNELPDEELKKVGRERSGGSGGYEA